MTTLNTSATQLPFLDPRQGGAAGSPAAESGPFYTPKEAKFPRSIDRVPYGRQRAFVLGLVVLGLGSVIAHKGWYEGFPRRAATLTHDLVGEVQRQWRSVRGGVAAPIPDTTPVLKTAGR